VENYLVTLVSIIVQMITVLLIVNALLSFAPLDPWHPVRRFMNQLTEPILRPFRGLMPPVGMFDFTPMIALIVIQILGQLVILIIRSSF
jgi:YggT family protein